ncbi:MAG: type II secretion system F family protein [Eubacterium sp.]|nr:type II secretion system F family protein [Eubacterium sp.]MCM1302666.1 type II secretion system F family protein [Butyrivibrio sp.]MCM1342205.1 type II secretion system F family protein [Muribaculaceae bacterium]MCM1409220.1 type II secretion system F family protein [Lachnospiraceae bacterium]
MEEKQILWMLKLLPVVSALLTVLLFYVLRTAYHPERLALKAYRELSGLLRERGKRSVWYLRMEKWLRKNGAAFHYGKKIDPERFLAVRIFLAMCGFLALGRINVWAGVGGLAALFFLPALFLEYLNRRDNERMLPELKLVYHALEIQIQAGVYVTDALSECYGSVQERRLRRALLDLAGDIVMKADIYEALDRFQTCFDNRYIDALCITILQALESGQALALLGDISEQIKDMEETVLERKKGALDRSITFYQLGVLTVILGMALYACVTYLFGAASNF